VATDNIQKFLMGLFDFLKPKTQKGQFVSVAAFEENKNQRTRGAIAIIEQLRTFNITSDKFFKLEYFFHTNQDEKASHLAGEIEKLNYSVKHGPAADHKSLFVVTGWTTKIKMEELIISNWVTEMCELGYKFDCLFDGWGTDPNQQ
jgi:regulator of RNase E activity RraB